jgi:hypothetical protein
MLLESFTSSYRLSVKPDQVVITPDGPGEDMAANHGGQEADENMPDDDVELKNSLPEDFDDLYAYLKSYIEDNQMGGSVQLSRPSDGCIFIRFSVTSFLADSAVLRKENIGSDFQGTGLKT